MTGERVLIRLLILSYALSIQFRVSFIYKNIRTGNEGNYADVCARNVYRDRGVSARSKFKAEERTEENTARRGRETLTRSIG